MTEPATTPNPPTLPAGPPRWRAWLWLLSAALGATVGLHLLVEHWGLGGNETAAAAAEAQAASAPAGSAAGSPAAASAVQPGFGQTAEAAARVGRAASAALASARAAAGLAPKPPAERVFDLCDVGRLTIPEPPASGPEASFEPLPRALGLYARQQAWQQILASLGASGQPPAQQAAALAVRASGLVDLEASPATLAAAAAGQPVQAEAREATRALARLARSSADPLALHWALAACERVGPASLPECRRISWRDLARAVPEDGQVWLALAAQPGVPRAEREAALDRAAAAPAYGTLAMRLPALVDAAWPAGLPGYLRLEVLASAIGIDAALGAGLVQKSVLPCRDAALADPTGRARCEALARQMQTHARSLLDLGIARGLGRRLGWSEVETGAMSREIDELSRLVPQTEEAGQPYSCPAVEDTRQWLQAVARDGELSELRRRATQASTPRPASSRP